MKIKNVSGCGLPTYYQLVDVILKSMNNKLQDPLKHSGIFSPNTFQYHDKEININISD